MIRRVGWLVFVLVLAAARCVAQDEAQSARRLIAGGHFAEARAIYEKLLDLDSQNVEYRIWIARLSAWLKDYPRSIATYDEVLKREPRNTEALVGKAYVLLWQHQYSEAGALLAEAAALAPDDPDVELAQARMYHYQGRERLAAVHVKRALAADAGNSDASDLNREIDLPRPVEIRVGFTQDRFSFTAPGNMGSVAAGYEGERNRVELQYEEWSRFGERARRAGVNLIRRSGGWWLRGGAMVGPGALVVPRGEYTAGVSHSLPKRFAWDLDYRLMRFHAADVHLLSPAISYYFAKPAWVTVTSYSSWTNWRTGPASGGARESWYAQYYQTVAKPVTLHAGFARGSESFEALSVDQLGFFQASTYIAGIGLKLSRAYSTDLFFAYQDRSNHTHQTSFGVSFTARR